MNLRGVCHILYCLDLAQDINLVLAKERLVAWRQALFQHKSRVLTGAAVLPPLRVRFDAESVAVGAWQTEAEVELAIYNIGTLGVTWSIPFDGPFEGLVDLASLLYDNPNLLESSDRLARELLGSIGDAATEPHVSALVEDYVTFEVREGEVPLDSAGRLQLARVLRAEPAALSQQEVDDCLSDFVAYRADEGCFIDWVGALSWGGAFEDERLVLELANVELLGLRALDARLDHEITTAYDIINRPARMFHWGHDRRDLNRIGQMQAEGAVLFEGIDNALKLVSDDYLARVYRTTAERFHFNYWDASIERKLEVLRNVYQNLVDRAAHRRSELLEWIIILLIAVELVLYFFPLD